ncbi:hypothetical protein MLD38_013133 [Melastoma candidum]|uniref:Uncharacterized protein n=1 Tax=Melastoma candidum TaxID=119954 RepID=A0ACB9R8J8_9MYRT|nr:hypothetical protein MLD38_013133 [Melastoma candidum]
MLTPQRKVWPGWSLSPGGGGVNQAKGSSLKASDGEKGKGVPNAVSGEPSMLHLGANGMAIDSSNLRDKVTQLEKELYEYQYNLGLLLIEKKEWNEKYEGLIQRLAEAKDTLKREQAAHLIAMSEIEKRENDLQNALGVEKQCVADLEKALQEMRAEDAEIKFTADSKLAEANALVTGIEEKSLEVEAKLRSADAKLAEISRKTSEIQRKSNDLEAREAALRRERLTFITERESQESIFSKQWEDLLEWERKLKEGEERVSDSLRMINQREDMANEKDRACKQKQKEVEESQRMIDIANLKLREKEDDIMSRLTTLKLKEKEHESLRKKLETKEEELMVLEEKLNTRERDEIQKLLEEHNRVLEEKKEELECEFEQKKKSINEELERRCLDVQKKEVELNHREEKFLKREQALEKKSDKVKEREEDLRLKLKDLKEREKSLKSEEKKLEVERKELLAQKEELLSVKALLEKERKDCEEQLLEICEEKDRLKVTDEERLEFIRVQSELKEQIEKCRLQKELLLKESEELKQQRQAFEKEWEELDNRKVDVERKLGEIIIQNEKFEKYKEYLEVLSEFEAVEIPPSKLIEEYADKEADGNASTQHNDTPNLAGSKSPFSGMSWIRKCTSRIFSLSPGKRADNHLVQDLNAKEEVTDKQDVFKEPSKESFGNDAEFSFAETSGCVNVDRFQRSDETGQEISFDNISNPNSNMQAVAEDSKTSEVKRGRGRPRGKAKVNRTRTMKQVVKDAETIFGTGMKPTDGEMQNGTAEGSTFMNPESRGESSLAEERGRPRKARKRDHDPSFELVADDTDDHSDSIVSERRRKRRQRPPAPVESRYNLRRRDGKGAGSGVSSELIKGKKGDPAGLDTREDVNHAKVAPTCSVIPANSNGEIAHVERHSNAADKMEGNIKGVRGTDLGMSEEVNGTPDRAAVDDECRGISQGNKGTAGNKDDNGEEFEHPGEVSVGKKIWDFLRT